MKTTINETNPLPSGVSSSWVWKYFFKPISAVGCFLVYPLAFVYGFVTEFVKIMFEPEEAQDIDCEE